MKTLIILLLISTLAFFSIDQFRPDIFHEMPKVGDVVDSLDNVYVYYNSDVGTVIGRNVKEGYNIGLKYQCVEFVKRYYFEHYNHRMPDSYGHAISFYNPTVEDGGLNSQRNLQQFTNPSGSEPKKGDLIVMDATLFNAYGHVAIISSVNDKEIEIIQQNPGPKAASRETFKLEKTEEPNWFIENNKILGWLRITEK